MFSCSKDAKADRIRDTPEPHMKLLLLLLSTKTWWGSADGAQALDSNFAHLQTVPPLSELGLSHGYGLN